MSASDGEEQITQKPYINPAASWQLFCCVLLFLATYQYLFKTVKYVYLATLERRAQKKRRELVSEPKQPARSNKAALRAKQSTMPTISYSAIASLGLTQEAASNAAPDKKVTALPSDKRRKLSTAMPPAIKAASSTSVAALPKPLNKPVVRSIGIQVGPEISSSVVQTDPPFLRSSTYNSRAYSFPSSTASLFGDDEFGFDGEDELFTGNRSYASMAATSGSHQPSQSTSKAPLLPLSLNKSGAIAQRRHHRNMSSISSASAIPITPLANSSGGRELRKKDSFTSSIDASRSSYASPISTPATTVISTASSVSSQSLLQSPPPNTDCSVSMTRELSNELSKTPATLKVDPAASKRASSKKKTANWVPGMPKPIDVPEAVEQIDPSSSKLVQFSPDRKVTGLPKDDPTSLPSAPLPLDGSSCSPPWLSSTTEAIPLRPLHERPLISPRQQNRSTSQPLLSTSLGSNSHVFHQQPQLFYQHHMQNVPPLNLNQNPLPIMYQHRGSSSGLQQGSPQPPPVMQLPVQVQHPQTAARLSTGMPQQHIAALQMLQSQAQMYQNLVGLSHNEQSQHWTAASNQPSPSSTYFSNNMLQPNYGARHDQPFINKKPSYTSLKNPLPSTPEHQADESALAGKLAALEAKVKKAEVENERKSKELEIASWRLQCVEVERAAERAAEEKQKQDAICYFVEKAEAAESRIKLLEERFGLITQNGAEDDGLEEERSGSTSDTSLSFSGLGSRSQLDLSMASATSVTNSPKPKSPQLPRLELASLPGLMSPPLHSYYASPTGTSLPNYYTSQLPYPSPHIYGSPTPGPRFSRKRHGGGRNKRKGSSRVNSPNLPAQVLKDSRAASSENQSKPSLRVQEAADPEGPDSDEDIEIVLESTGSAWAASPALLPISNQDIEDAAMVGLGLECPDPHTATKQPPLLLATDDAFPDIEMPHGCVGDVPGMWRSESRKSTSG